MMRYQKLLRKEKRKMSNTLRQSLTKDQQIGLKQISDHLSNNDRGTILVNGRAGSGKTHLLSKVLNNRDVYIAAPTHRAVNELSNRLPHSGRMTTHSLLGANPIIDDNTGDLLFMLGENKYVPDNAILVIDESGMLPKNHFRAINQIFANRMIIVYAGDEQQLPPINESSSEVFDHTHDLKVELHEIVRYEGAILEYAQSILRNELESPKELFSKNITRSWKESLINHVEDMDFRETSMIAYRNVTVDKWNDLAREFIYDVREEELKYYNIGDQIILTKPYNILNSIGEIEYTFTTNERGVILDLEPDKIKLRGEYFDCYLAKISFPETGRDPIYCHLPDQTIKDLFVNWKKEILHKIETESHTTLNPRSLWGHWYGQQSKLLEFKFSYAITAHRAQGSTIKNVFVDTKDIMVCKSKNDRRKLLYTSITRSSENLTVN